MLSVIPSIHRVFHRIMSKKLITKFSGKKDAYKGGATRDRRAGKGRYDLITPLMLRRLAGVYERGAINHGDRNWEKGIPFSRLLDSAMRHINQYREGLRDEDHIAQAIWNLAALIHFEEEKRIDLDDIPRYHIGTVR